ncbi:MAG: uroporphyrinogen decarboxylase family protein [Clostridia bacterium]
MNSRERVLCTLNHKEPDRIPLDLGVGKTCKFSLGAYSKMKDYLGLDESNVRLSNKTAQLAFASDELLEELEVDIRAPYPYMTKAPNKEWEDETSYFLKNDWGTVWRMPKEKGHYYDMIEFPLLGKEAESDKDYVWPDIPKLKKEAVEEAKRYKEAGYAVIFPDHLGNGFLQTGPTVYGFDQWLMMLALEKKRVEAFLDKLLEMKMKYWDGVLEEFGDTIDIICESDDLGTQSGPFISPQMYREIVKPRQKELFQYLKRKTKAKIFLHSCGSIVKLIPDLIEAGIDILNPIQVSATGMDPLTLKKDFGDSIVFWGAGVDSQKVLPTGTPEQVKDEVKRRIEELAPGGGFVFAPIHNIQSDVPQANLVAMWEAFKQYRNY